MSTTGSGGSSTTSSPTALPSLSVTPSTTIASTAASTSLQQTSSSTPATTSPPLPSSASTISSTTVASSLTVPSDITLSTTNPAQATSTLLVATTIVPTTSGGVVLTIVTAVAPTSTPSSSNAGAPSSNSFWNNTGAVAGVFTVVGLIGLAFLILLVTTAVRRRRAVNFDKEVAAAAQAAKVDPGHDFMDNPTSPSDSPPDPFAPPPVGAGWSESSGIAGVGAGQIEPRLTMPSSSIGHQQMSTGGPSPAPAFIPNQRFQQHLLGNSPYPTLRRGLSTTPDSQTLPSGVGLANLRVTNP